MDVAVIIEWVIKVGAFLGAMGVVFNYLMKPVHNLLVPLNTAIEQLNELLAESQEDRKRLHGITKRQNEMLAKHDWEIDKLKEFEREHIAYHKEEIIKRRD